MLDCNEYSLKSCKMKTITKSLLTLSLIILSVFFTKQLIAQPNQISFQVFYDQLSPYGQWLDNPDYGYAWIPDEGPDFAPYSTEGNWVYTDFGWTWVSQYEWGWAPFHYGRWDYDNYYGWFWVPDTEWGPAWVNWRSADGYYGWMPMQPGVSINIGFHRDYNDRNDHWTFVRNRDIDLPHINLYFVGREDHDRIVRNSTVVRNTYDDRTRNTTYVSGPRREDVQNATGKKLRPVVIRENTNPGQRLRNGKLNLYRPQVNREDNKEHRIAPSRVTNVQELREESDRRRTNNQQQNVNSSNNRREQQSKTIKPSDDRRDQQKKSVRPPRNTRKEEAKKSETDKQNERKRKD